ncbi:DUF2145 domain-containing protein [Legionella sp. D16C41]|uniref:DUF2145 domain-containing protein n=1 Tax=Legionella sp. D16C41 TaxID=3402688 RepID=UPI003AF4C3E9
MKFLMLPRLFWCLLLFIVCPAMEAGTSCKKISVKPELYIQATRIALEAQNKLNKSHAQVALIARVGTNLEKYGLHYSHVGFVIKDYPNAVGKWTVLHLLNECGTAYSSLYAQGLMNFFLDNLYSMDYQIIIPDFDTQKKLNNILLTNKIKKLHSKYYSVLAYPYSTMYQNSNQWILEVLAASLQNKAVDSRRNLQKYLLKTGYKPTVIKLSPVTKLGASMFNTSVAFNDHPSHELLTNQFSTVTVESIVNYLKQHKIIQKIIK